MDGSPNIEEVITNTIHKACYSNLNCSSSQLFSFLMQMCMRSVDGRSNVSLPEPLCHHKNVQHSKHNGAGWRRFIEPRLYHWFSCSLLSLFFWCLIFSATSGWLSVLFSPIWKTFQISLEISRTTIFRRTNKWIWNTSAQIDQSCFCTEPNGSST